MITKDKVRSITLTLDKELFDLTIASSGQQPAGEYLEGLQAEFGVPLYIRETAGGSQPLRYAGIEIRNRMLVVRKYA